MHRLSAAALLAVACLLTTGCSPWRDSSPGPSSPAGLALPGFGSKTPSATFQRKVENDPFPNAGKSRS